MLVVEQAVEIRLLSRQGKSIRATWARCYCTWDLHLG